VSSETTTEPPAPTRREHRAAGRSRARDVFYGVVGVIGELLITLGVLLFAFLLWQLWWTDVVGNRVQADIVAELPFEPVPTATPTAGVPAGPVIAPPRRDEPPPVMAEPPHATTFATIQVPRWAGEPERPISQGTDRATVLDVLGAGHYEGTAMPGGLGNFAVAGHRTTYAAPFRRMNRLRRGDKITLTMPYGRFTYRVEGLRVVLPQNTGVLKHVRHNRLVLTTCTPVDSAAKRLVTTARLVRAEARGPAVTLVPTLPVAPF